MPRSQSGSYVTTVECYVAETMGGQDDGKLVMGLRLRDADGVLRMRFFNRRMARKLKRDIEQFLADTAEEGQG